MRMSKHSHNGYNLYEMVDGLEKLTFEQARELYTLYVNEVDIEKKKELRTKIIKGTLYIVFDFIQNNQFDLLHSGSYDMDDIMNTAFEIWIRKIDEGKLLEVKFPSQIFNHTFYFEMGRVLVNDDYEVNFQLNVNSEIFIELLSMFIYIKNKDNNFRYEKFMQLIQINKKYRYLLLRKDIEFVKIYLLFDTIYHSFQKDEVDIAKTKIKWLLALLIQNGLEDSKANTYNVREDSFEDEIVMKEAFREFLDVVFNECRLTEREKIVLKERFGIDIDKVQTLKQVGKKFNVSCDKIRQIESHALRKVRGTQKIKGFRDLLD